MKIGVCVKQVPMVREAPRDLETGSILRELVGSEPNPSDVHALWGALALAEMQKARTMAITMGPKQAKASIRQAFSFGIEEGIHMMDPAFAGADVWMTAKTLSLGLGHGGLPEVVICGKESADGDTGQLAGELSQMLGYGFLPHVTKWLKIEGDFLYAESKMDGQVLQIKVKMPVVCTIYPESFEKKYPSFRAVMDAKKRPISVLTAKDFSPHQSFGYGASPTQILKIYEPKRERKAHLLTGTQEEQALFVAQIMRGEAK